MQANENLPEVGGGSGNSDDQGTHRDVSPPISTASSLTKTLSAEWDNPIMDDNRRQHRRASSSQVDIYAEQPGAQEGQRPRKKRSMVNARGKANESGSSGRSTSPFRPGVVDDGQGRRGRMFTADGGWTVSKNSSTSSTSSEEQVKRDGGRGSRTRY